MGPCSAPPPPITPPSRCFPSAWCSSPGWALSNSIPRSSKRNGRTCSKRVADNVSPWLADQLGDILTGVQERATLGGPLGLLALLLGGHRHLHAIEQRLARIWGSTDPSVKSWLAAVRAALWDRLSAFLTLLAIGAALLIVVFLGDVVLAAVRPYVVKLPAGGLTWRSLQSLLAIGCDTVLLGAIYHTLPKAHVPWRAALGGGLLAAVIWAIGRYLLLCLVVGEQYSAYGVLGALMGVMLWFYYASAVVFLGAEFVHALSEE